MIMPRKARVKSKIGIYHIILRGNNRQNIFNDNEDKKRLLETLLRYKEKCKYQLYAYCFMDNHIHLLMKEREEPLEQIMRRIGVSYVYWYNHKYDRVGNLFQDRFKSEVVEDETYFLTVLRYIHQNPIKAGIVKSLKEYPWSSYIEYIGREQLIDKELVIGMFNENKNEKMMSFIKFHSEINEDKCLEIQEKKKRTTDEQLIKIIYETYNINAKDISNEPWGKRKEILQGLLKIQGVSTRQLARVTDVSPNIIWKL